ncbi:MAG: multicopper oxidase family protein [Bryobacteraceae bacterium]
MMQRMTGREGSLITVGNAVNPRIEIRAGGLLRLRILNASASRFYRLKLEEHPMYVIATDGGPLPAPRAVEEILLSPGERADVLVRGSRDNGVYRLLNLPYNRGGTGMMGGVFTRREPEVLAALFYEGRVEPALDLPARLVQVDPLPPPEAPVRRFALNELGMPGRGMRFTINGREFDHDRVDTRVRLGTVEDWEIVNRGGMDHPFHLHTNSFQILDAKGEPELAWKDVILVRAGETRRFRVRFEDFAGKAVYHCHILDHEDLGMMGVIEMID